MSLPISLTVDAWELRCRFNKGRYWERLQANEFNMRTKSKQANPAYRLGPGGLSQEVYYIHRTTGIQIARMHQLVKADGTLGGGGKPDPKELLIDSTLYHLHSGSGIAGDIKRDPSLRYNAAWLQWVYKLWRKIKCLQLGGKMTTRHE